MSLGLDILKENRHPGAPPRQSPVPTCEHVRTRFVWRVYAGKDQTPRFGFQCLDCGKCDLRRSGELHNKWVGPAKCFDTHGKRPDEARPYDDAFTRAKAEHDRAFYAWRHEQKAEFRAAWWAWYDQYLASDVWKATRAQVLSRDRFLCQSCGAAAEQVHHLTYERVGYEELHDLVALCARCHVAQHETPV